MVEQVADSNCLINKCSKINQKVSDSSPPESLQDSLPFRRRRANKQVLQNESKII